MLDKIVTPAAHALLRPIINILDKANVKPDHITFCGFLLGMISVPLIAFHYYHLALLFIILNRVFDGIDGELARRQNASSDAGGFLDICLDFTFYAFVPFGFVLANAPQNGIAGAALIAAFMGTGSSFLAFAIMAEKYKITRMQFEKKSFHYLNGLAEGTETILFFVGFCLFPSLFPELAWAFFGICCITIITRISGGYKTIKQYQN
ncbi:CDP-alcohol phosphatidyltransferase family protein [Alteromonas sp. 5E99-2]|uniref:CDP-alcohol phosphatidyltransferase family protein n=1 Tax=Alteromonas sp. 5E99-2 TaxID=2817683 RepID=UPI001A997E70|nr:CDP-alcohol phosphatidyltransferase family protein [Alteromonas sp. 5E99-2]MBO1254908.1 CDP-alcohol phosphatidyltransferase family protein [Alteromonas sp. 5E99-2]